MGIEALIVPVVSKMIAGEEIAVVDEQAAVAARVSRRRDRDHAGRERLRFVAVEDDLGVGLGVELGAMDVAPAAEMGGVSVGVGDVVAMREEDAGDAAELLESAHEPGGWNFGALDEPVVPSGRWTK